VAVGIYAGEMEEGVNSLAMAQDVPECQNVVRGKVECGTERVPRWKEWLEVTISQLIHQRPGNLLPLHAVP